MRAQNLEARNAIFENTPDLQQTLTALDAILMGKQQQIRLAMACLITGGHLLIEDSPGVGKSTLAQSLAQVFDLAWKRIQFTSDLLPADIIGVSIFNSKTQRFEFHQGPIFSTLVLADEINRAPPKAQSALLEAMEENQVSVDGTTHQLPHPFFVIATLNPADRLGAYQLPESQLDRFLAGITIGYPDAHSERELLTLGDRRKDLAALSGISDTNSLMHWREKARAVHASGAVLDYLQALLQATRVETGMSYNGLSPRAGLKLLAMARTWAMMQGRKMLLPEDIQDVFPAVAGHRLAGSVKDGLSVADDYLAMVPVN